jgi:uncharacterized protein (DUF1330 family)
MSAYVIVDIEVKDSTGYEEYKRTAAPTVTMYGGSYLARGGRTEVLEGSWQPHRLVILEFPSIARAKEWLNSPEYCAIKHIRHEHARANMIVVEGI